MTEPLSGLRVESFDPNRHDRGEFSCGIARIDNFLKLSARKQQAHDFSRIRVACRPQSEATVGFLAMNAHAVGAADLPAAMTRHAGRHGVIPAAYLSMIGVDRRLQGLGIGRLLLVDALMSVARAAEHIGLKAVLLDVIADGGEDRMRQRLTFYRSMGFQPFPHQPFRLFLPVATIKELSDGGPSSVS